MINMFSVFMNFSLFYFSQRTNMDVTNISAHASLEEQIVQEKCVNATAETFASRFEFEALCLNATLYSSNDTRSLDQPFLLPFWQKLSWTVLFSLMIIIASLGNILVMWVILAHRRMRNATNYFLLNLSAADLLMATLNVIFNFIFMIDSNWPFGAYYCQINNFVANMSVSSSVFSIVAVSIDR